MEEFFHTVELRLNGLAAMKARHDLVVKWASDVPEQMYKQILSEEVSEYMFGFYLNYIDLETTIFPILKEVEYEGFVLSGGGDEYYFLCYVDGKTINTSKEKQRMLDLIIPIAYGNSKGEVYSFINNLHKINLPVLDISGELSNKDLNSLKLNLMLNYRLKKEITELPSLNCSILDRKKIMKKPGLYILYNEEYEIVYVGKAKSLFDRVGSHIKGATHTKEYSHEFKYVSVFYLSDYDAHSDLLERDFIRNLKPRRNIVFQV